MVTINIAVIFFVVLLLHAEFCLTYDERCDVNYDEGRCKIVTRYRYDRRTRRCVAFDYKGEGGNTNKFNTYEACQFRCENDRPLAFAA